MEDNIKEEKDIDFHLLFTNPKKVYETKLIAKIEDINSKTEEISLVITSLKKPRICYKG